MFGCSGLNSASGSMWGYVTVTSHKSSVRGTISKEQSSGFPGVFCVSSVDKSDCTGCSGESGAVILSFSASKVGFSYSQSHALAYKSSCFRLSSGSEFRSCGVICISGRGLRDVN